MKNYKSYTIKQLIWIAFKSFIYAAVGMAAIIAFLFWVHISLGDKLIN